MTVHQIQALLTGLIALFIGWQLVRALMTGEVTISREGHVVKRADNARRYWLWTGITLALELVVIVICVGALRAR